MRKEGTKEIKGDNLSIKIHSEEYSEIKGSHKVHKRRFYRVEARFDIPEFGVKKGDIGGLIDKSIYDHLVYVDVSVYSEFKFLFWLDFDSILIGKAGNILNVSFSDYYTRSKVKDRVCKWLIKNSKLAIGTSHLNIRCNELYINDSTIYNASLIEGNYVELNRVLLTKANGILIDGHHNVILGGSQIIINPSKFLKLDRVRITSATIRRGIIIKSSGEITNSKITNNIDKTTMILEGECYLDINESTITNVNIDSNLKKVQLKRVALVGCKIIKYGDKDSKEELYIENSSIRHSTLKGSSSLISKLAYKPLKLINCFIRNTSIENDCIIKDCYSIGDDNDVIDLVGLTIKNGTVK